MLQYERNRGEAIYYPARTGNDNLDVSACFVATLQAIKVADG